MTLAFGTHVTPIPTEILRAFPVLDFVLRGEPELTLRELVDTLEAGRGRWQVAESGHLMSPRSGEEPAAHEFMWKMWREADLFTVNRAQVIELCERLIQSEIKASWTCNSRVDYVDEEMLQWIGRAGCLVIAWGIESGSAAVLRRAHKGYRMEQTHQPLTWARRAGILNWGYFIIGLPGETVETIQETIRISKKLPLDIVLFHVAAPYPGTPFFFQVVENGWFRPGMNWEEVDMDQATVLDYPNLKAEELLYWQRRAFREWALRPRPLLTYLKSMNTWEGFKSALNIGLQTLKWVK